MYRIELIGNLTRDPEKRVVKTADGEISVVNFTVAASEGYGDYKRTEFIRCAVWRSLSECCMKYLKKGSKVYAAGCPSVNSFINKDGSATGNLEVTLESIEFLSAKPVETDIADSVTDEDIEDLL